MRNWAVTVYLIGGAVSTTAGLSKDAADALYAAALVNPAMHAALLQSKS